MSLMALFFPTNNLHKDNFSDGFYLSVVCYGPEDVSSLKNDRSRPLGGPIAA